MLKLFFIYIFIHFILRRQLSQHEVSCAIYNQYFQRINARRNNVVSFADAGFELGLQGRHVLCLHSYHGFGAHFLAMSIVPRRVFLEDHRDDCSTNL